MRKILGLLAIGGLMLAVSIAPAQPPGGGRGGQPPGGGKKGSATKGEDAVAAAVAKMFEFDANKDGKLTKEEITDERLHALFDRAANKDGVVTKESLTDLLTKEAAAAPQGGGGRGAAGRSQARPGQILPAGLQDELKLTDDQKKQVADLQKDVDAKLAKILTVDQKKQMKDIAESGPGGGRGGRGGPGGPGGGPGGPGGGK